MKFLTTNSGNMFLDPGSISMCLHKKVLISKAKIDDSANKTLLVSFREAALATMETGLVTKIFDG